MILWFTLQPYNSFHKFQLELLDLVLDSDFTLSLGLIIKSTWITVKTALTVTSPIRSPAFSVNGLLHPCVFTIYLTPA